MPGSVETTKAAVLYEQGKPLRVEELQLPPLRAGQVLVRVRASGVCRSQLNEIDGKKGPDKFLPHVLGHEGAGVVEEMGPDVTKVKGGDHVVLTWIKGQGFDVPSASYRIDGRVVNSGAISTFGEYTVVSENRIVPIDKAMPLDKAALLGCAIPTGAGIVFNTIKPQPGSCVAVFGVGGIGASAVLAAKAARCDKIIAIDVHEAKLTVARDLGATDVVNASLDDPVKAIRDLTGQRGADYAVEAAGLKQTMEQAFASVKDGGGLAVLAGNVAQGEKIEIDPFDLIKGKRIIGTWGGESRPDTDIPMYVDLYLKGKLNLDRLITHRYCLEEINQAIAMLRNSNDACRILIEL
jgi:S-(hydroxymethyl)glutathione dehydrogenase/alcohol dehydrogenase